MTEWRKIPGLPDRFEASDRGEIRTLPYRTRVTRKNGQILMRPIDGKVLQPRFTGRKSKGHPTVTIAGESTKGTKLGEMRVSLLVCRAFHGCPYDPGDLKGCQKYRVLHIDSDITNTAPSNLKWIGSKGCGDTEYTQLYERNLRRLERDRKDPNAWLARVFGEELELEECES